MSVPEFYRLSETCQRFLSQIAAGRAPRRSQYLVGVAHDFLESLMETELYSIGAYFCDENPDLVDELVERAEEIERAGLEAYADAGDSTIEEAFETLLTGLAVRYYKAVAG
jgi:hypothetical protein